jgi:hypothetical protein
MGLGARFGCLGTEGQRNDDMYVTLLVRSTSCHG